MKNNHQIDLSLIFFACSFFIIIIGLFSKLTFQKGNSTGLNSQSSQIITPVQPKKIKLPKKLNYNAPIVCGYETKESSVSAAMKEEMISATVNTSGSSQTYTVQGDCVYTWNKEAKTGKKRCGVGEYIKLGRQLLSTGLGSVDTISTITSQFQTISNIDIQKFIDSCKNEKEIRNDVFSLPRGVVFKEEIGK